MEVRVLVTGGRTYNDRDTVNRVLDRLHQANPITMLIHGNSFGADLLAGQWARVNKVPVMPFQADWSRIGKAAGPLRNTRMIGTAQADLVVAFPGGAGTADCVRKAEAAGIFIYEVRR